jgi:hypothetical protein
MGHIRLGEMPRTGYWPDVIKTLDLSDDPARIANVTAKAARKGLDAAGQDHGVSEVIYMLMKFVWSSAAKKDLRRELKDIGVSTTKQDASLLDLISGFNDALDRRLRQKGHRSDLAEMARMSVVDTLTDVCRHQTGSLFGASIKETQEALRKNTAPERFAALGQRFFGKFLYRTLQEKSTAINEILARLLFGLASPHLSPLERTGVLSLVDQLIRLKVDLGLLKGVTYGC